MLKKTSPNKISSYNNLLRCLFFVINFTIIGSCTLLKRKKNKHSNDANKNISIKKPEQSDNLLETSDKQSESIRIEKPFSSEYDDIDSASKEHLDSEEDNKKAITSESANELQQDTKIDVLEQDILNENELTQNSVGYNADYNKDTISGDNVIEHSDKNLQNESILEKKEDPKDSAKEPIKYNIEYSSDSMFFDINKGKVQLTGNSNVNYGPNKLEAHKIGINWKKNILTAEAKITDGEVLIKDKFLILLDSKKYYAALLKLNFESQLAYIKKLFTSMEGAIIRANKLKKSYEDTLYIDNFSITTCNLPTPHYAIVGKKVIVNGQETVCSEEVVMEFADIPTIRLFMGLLYIPDKKQGIIPPTYGGSGDIANKGFHIKKFGYYWNFSDTIDLSITSDFHTGGSLAFEAESFYKTRYAFGGNIMYRIETTINKYDNFKRMWKLKWNHNSENNRYSSLFINIDLENEEYERQESAKGVSQNATKSSSIKYKTRFRDISFYQIALKAEYSRNKAAEKTSLLLPNITLYTPSLYLFNSKKIKNSWISDLNFKHSIEYKNIFATKRDYLDFFDPKDWLAIYDKKNYGIKNSIPIQCNIPIGFFNLIPNIEYNEILYFERLDKSNSKKSLENGFYRVWEIEPSLELNTTVYGTFLYTKNKNIEAIRHELNPSLKLTYSHGYPDYWQQIDSKYLSRYEDFVFSTPDHKQKLVLEGVFSNRFDMKLKEKDENGKNFKVPILESLDIISSYDFLEEDFPIGDLEIKASTSLFKKIIYIEGSQKYDQYSYDADHNMTYIREKSLAISNSQGLGHLKEGKLSIKMNLNSSAFDKENNQMDALMELLKKKMDAANPEAAAEQYVKFDIPWNLEVKYDYIYKSPIPNEIERSKVLSTDLKLNISQKWILGLVSAYDFSKASIVNDTTKITVYRDLHCWQFSFSWLPISKTQYFDFSIGVKAPILKALEYTRKDRKYTNV